MKSRPWRTTVLFAGVLALLGAGVPADESRRPQVTFTRDVAPIFYQRCAECHRPGQIAPMSLLTYQQARPWAKAIREKVLERTMPPWLAAPGFGPFENDRRLSQKEMDTIVAWVDAGAPKGDDQDLSSLPKFEEGWTLGRPDLVLSLPQEVDVPADGVIPYRYYTVPTNFTEDRWVQAAEIHPGNRSVVHHIIVFIDERGSKAAGGQEAAGNAAEAGEPTERAGSEAGRGTEVRERANFNKLAGFAPGEQPKVYPKGVAKLVKAGASFRFQVHYTPNGQPAKDRSYIGLFFAKDPVQRRALTGTATNLKLVIPPGDPNYEVQSSWTAKEDVRIVDLMPHMHLRGKDFTYTAVYPDGRRQVILQVPKYDFSWQLLYRFKEPLFLAKGSRLDCVAHFDNSAANKNNPDPTKEVRWGPQTWEEMMIGWFDYTLEGENLEQVARQ